MSSAILYSSAILRVGESQQEMCQKMLTAEAMCQESGETKNDVSYSVGKRWGCMTMVFKMVLITYHDR